MKQDIRTAIDGKVPCMRCKKGFMKLLSAVNDYRFIMECNFCGAKDDLEFKRVGKKLNIVLKKE